MREILNGCIDLDSRAHDAYLDLAQRCTDADVARIMGAMAAEEAQHVEWWTEILGAWEAGLVPDIWTGTSRARDALASAEAELDALSGLTGPVSPEAALTAAVRVEFFALDPVFGDLLDLAEPAVSHGRHDAYSRHIERLIEAVEHHFPRESLVRFLAHVLRRAQRENRVLSRFATRDPLTGLSNRRALTAYLNQWTSWAARYGRPVALLVLDIDRFKEVNDRFGHGVGDRTLTHVAGAISSTLRGSDLAARFGGDEFAVIAPELDAPAARALADRILAAVEAVDVESPHGLPVRVSASVGVAVVDEEPNSPARPLDHLLSAADMSMYAAKRAGGARTGEPIVLSSPDAP